MSIKEMELAEDPDSYLKRLADLGIKKLGKGAYMTVFQHPKMPNVVVKFGIIAPVSRSLQWLQWCKSNPSVYVPKVHLVQMLDMDVAPKAPKVFKNNPPKYFLAFVEKLAKASIEDVEQFIGSYGFAFEYNDSTNTWMIDEEGVPEIKDKALQKTLLKIRDLAEQSSYDLRKNNFMLRGDQVVFNDPIV